MSVVLSLIQGLFRLEKTQHFWWEHVLFRVGIAYLVWTCVPYVTYAHSGHPHYDTLPVPSSVGTWWPGLTMLSDPAVFSVVRQWFWVALVMYAVGIGVPLALTYLVAVVTCIGSLHASQGAHGHSTQVMGLLLLGMAMAAWVVPFLKGRGGWRNALLWTQTSPQDFVVQWGRQMVVASYMVSAVTKEINSNGPWFLRYDSFVLSVVKAQEEAVIKGTPITEAAMQFAEWMAEHSYLSTLMLLGAWLLEFGAPIALLNRRMAVLIAVMLWVFHYMNAWLMGLPFELNRSIVVVLFLNLPFWIVWMVAKAGWPRSKIAQT